MGYVGEAFVVMAAAPNSNLKAMVTAAVEDCLDVGIEGRRDDEDRLWGGGGVEPLVLDGGLEEGGVGGGAFGVKEIVGNGVVEKASDQNGLMGDVGDWWG